MVSRMTTVIRDCDGDRSLGPKGFLHDGIIYIYIYKHFVYVSYKCKKIYRKYWFLV